MSPLTKETSEIIGQSTESAVSRPAAPAVNPARLRSEAVSLEIPIKVHGSRVTEVVMGATPHTEPFEEQSTTMIVFSLGGVLKMSTPVTTGQMMVLTNLKTRQDVICRVLKVRNNPNLQSYVEIEFTHPQPGYWGVFFPSDEVESDKVPAIPSQPLTPEPPARVESGADVSQPVAASPVASAKPPVAAPPSNLYAVSPAYVPPPAQPESAFISIGSKEEVQAPASSPFSKNIRLLEDANDLSAVIAPKKNSPAGLTSAPTASSASAASGMSIAESAANSKIELQSLAEIPVASPAPVLSAADAGPNSASSREAFGSTLGVSATGSLAASAAPRRNWLLIAACAVFAVVVGGGAMYFVGGSSKSSAANSAASAPEAPPVDTTKTLASNGAGQSPYSIPASRGDVIVTDSPSPEKLDSSRNSKAIVTDHSDTPPPAQAVTRAESRSIARTANAKPVTAKRGGANAVDAPTLDAVTTAPATGGPLPGILGSSNALPLPPSGSPAPVGGTVTAPKLVTSTPPIYPPAAKQAKVEGDVIVHAVIDSSGRVTQVTVVSGPPLLRDAAMSAVKLWKYSPAILNGETVASDTTVTLKFRN